MLKNRLINSTDTHDTFQLIKRKVVKKKTDWSHSYWIDDQWYPSVTTILEHGLPQSIGLIEYWKSRTPDAIDDTLEDAKQRGSNVHHAIEKLLKGEPIELVDYNRKREKDALVGFWDWFQTWEPEEFQSEQVVVFEHPDISYAGTLDMVLRLNGETWLIDFKTSRHSTETASHHLQLAAYKEAYEQSHGITVDRIGVLYLGTSHKRTNKEEPPTRGKMWALEEVDQGKYTPDAFKRVYDMCLFLNEKFLEPPLVNEYPDKIKLFKE